VEDVEPKVCERDQSAKSKSKALETSMVAKTGRFGGTFLLEAVPDRLGQEKNLVNRCPTRLKAGLRRRDEIF